MEPMTDKQPKCCSIDCEKPATWQAWDGPMLDDYTEACDDHLGHFLSDKPEHRVFLLAASKLPASVLDELSEAIKYPASTVQAPEEVESLPIEAKEKEEICKHCDQPLIAGSFEWIHADKIFRAHDPTPKSGKSWATAEPKPTPSAPIDPLEPWKDDPETPDDRVNASHLLCAFNGSNHDAAVRFSRDLVHARRMLLEACAISRHLSDEIVDLRKQLDALKPQPDSSSISTEQTFWKWMKRSPYSHWLDVYGHVRTEYEIHASIAQTVWNAAKGSK